jgi:hypothetical protein
MTQEQIDNQLAPDSLVLPHQSGRAIAFVAAIFALTIAIGYQSAHTPMGIWRVGELLACAGLIYIGLVVAFDAVRGVPLLQTSDSGIVINGPVGRMFVGWSDTVAFSEGNFEWWLRIRQREGAAPAGSILTRILNASLWARSTIAVPLFTTGGHGAAIAQILTQIRSRKLAL